MDLRSLHILRANRTSEGDAGQRKPGTFLMLLFAGAILAPLLLCGCGHFSEGSRARAAFSEANDFFSTGNYVGSLGAYQQIVERYPATADRALFEMGIIYAYSGNEQKDYQKALECFRKLITDYPGSGYRKDGELMVFNVANVIFKDRTIAAQHAHIGILEQEIARNGTEVAALQEKIAALDREVKSRESENAALRKEIFAAQKGPVDKILIEKKERRLTLILKGKALKTYKIALGGNPEGPKERQGDNKTPEGTYTIDSRNRDSGYHLSLHISYPNETDRKRARELGVAPGGDIMIHGIKNGLAWVGGRHAEVDWTKGCIAVTDEEIEEIDRLAPNGTIVEIVPGG